ncbi:MAG: DegT/DnrJ/EryC1/StrS family aminotransferase [Paludibacter sp.]|nr:DegT/DnrJ/EryC1/StrS family aminotransferase [Paludibacter sp.]
MQVLRKIYVINLFINRNIGVGVDYKGKKAGNLADISVFSFHAVKKFDYCRRWSN